MDSPHIYAQKWATPFLSNTLDPVSPVTPLRSRKRLDSREQDAGRKFWMSTGGSIDKGLLKFAEISFGWHERITSPAPPGRGDDA